MARKSLVPDPEIIIYVANAISLYFGSKIVAKVGDKLLDLAVDEVAKFYSFVRPIVIKSLKYAIPSGRPITYVFVVPGDPCIEFVIRSTNADAVISAVLLEKLEAAIAKAGELNKTLGAVKIQYLLNDAGKWEFNYLLTGSGEVIGTEKSYERRGRIIELLVKATKQEDQNLSLPGEEN